MVEINRKTTHHDSETGLAFWSVLGNQEGQDHTFWCNTVLENDHFPHEGPHKASHISSYIDQGLGLERVEAFLSPADWHYDSETGLAFWSVLGNHEGQYHTWCNTVSKNGHLPHKAMHISSYKYQGLLVSPAVR